MSSSKLPAYREAARLLTTAAMIDLQPSNVDRRVAILDSALESKEWIGLANAFNGIEGLTGAAQMGVVTVLSDLTGDSLLDLRELWRKGQTGPLGDAIKQTWDHRMKVARITFEMTGRHQTTASDKRTRFGGFLLFAVAEIVVTYGTNSCRIKHGLPYFCRTTDEKKAPRCLSA
jgi:hypothetical protein